MSERKKQKNIHFVGVSHASKSIDMAQGIVAQINELDSNALVATHPVSGRRVVLLCPVLLLQADNPAASEMASHSGHMALHGCRRCNVLTKPLTWEEFQTYMKALLFMIGWPITVQAWNSWTSSRIHPYFQTKTIKNERSWKNTARHWC